MNLEQPASLGSRHGASPLRIDRGEVSHVAKCSRIGAIVAELSLTPKAASPQASMLMDVSKVIYGVQPFSLLLSPHLNAVFSPIHTGHKGPS